MILILNGTPRSGKTSIAQEVQRTFPGVWVNLGVDHSVALTPEPFRPGVGLRPGGERPELEPLVQALYRALFDSIAAYANNEIHVVSDLGLHSNYRSDFDAWNEAMARLAGLPRWVVGVRCPTDEIIRRRVHTGMNAPREIVERWDQAVHVGHPYDIEVDTSTLSPAQCAQSILRALSG